MEKNIKVDAIPFSKDKVRHYSKTKKILLDIFALVYWLKLLKFGCMYLKCVAYRIKTIVLAIFAIKSDKFAMRWFSDDLTSIFYISQLVEEQLTIELEKGAISNQSTTASGSSQTTASSQHTVAAATEEKLSSETASLRVTESEPPTRMAENFNSYRVGQQFTFYYVYGKIEDATWK